jgi:hypothetical protein
MNRFKVSTIIVFPSGLGSLAAVGSGVVVNLEAAVLETGPDSASVTGILIQIRPDLTCSYSKKDKEW